MAAPSTTSERKWPTIDGSVCHPGDALYTHSVNRAWNKIFRDVKPVAVVLPKNTNDVVRIVKFCKEEKLSLSVLGGAHNAAGRGTQGQVMLDMCRMSNVHVNPTERKAYVHGGATWRDVDSVCDLYKLATPGGIVHETGVAGLALGGGWGFLTKKYGLTCDNVLELEIVTADGSVLTCSDTANSDLFWALLGTGAGTLGVVTHLVLRLYDAPKLVYNGVIGWPVAQWRPIVKAINAGKPSWPNEFVCFPVIMHPDPNQPNFLACMLLVYCDGGQAVAQKYLDPIFQAAGGPPPVNFASDKNYLDAQAFVANLFPPHRVYWKAFFSSELSEEIVEAAVSHVQKLPESFDKGRFSGIAFENYFSKDFRGHSTQRTSFSHKPVSEFLVLANASWEDKNEDEKMIAWSKDFIEKNSAKLKGGAANFISGGTTVEKTFGEEVGKRFAEIKKKYDPDNFFKFNSFQ